MKTLSVALPERAASAYPIHVGRGEALGLPQLVQGLTPSSVLIICDERVRGAPALAEVPYPIYAIAKNGEEQKTTAVLETLWDQMLRQKIDRSSLIVAVGGGTTGDVVGFAAATYMRGVRWINVPTTLLSQVDSSIGGKTGINLGKVKNLVGAFSFPSAVIIDPQFLETLPLREFASGCAEIIKHGIIYDASLFNLLKKRPLSLADAATLEDIIVRSLEVKKAVVEKDPYEKGLRKILNFGHTVGHAVETMSHREGRPLLHGEAIAIGMAAEAQIAHGLGLIDAASVDTVQAVLQSHTLPTELPAFDAAEVLTIIENDKKNRGGSLLFSLPSGIGKCSFDTEVSKDVVLETLRRQ